MPHNGTHTNGQGAHAPTMREKVVFRANVPEFLTLEFDPPTDARPGRYGDQFMYFCGPRILWADPPLHEAIVRSGAKAGDEVAITKTTHGRAIKWQVARVEEEPPEAHTPPTPPPPAPPKQTAAPAPDPQPAPAAQISATTQALAAALVSAIQAAKLAGITLSEEGLLKLAITAYIGSQGGKQRA